MQFMDILKDFYWGPAFGMLNIVLFSYVLVYIAALVITRIWVYLRKGVRPCADTITYLTLSILIVICTGWPIYYSIKLFTKQPWHIIPFGLACLVNLVILTNLCGKLRKTYRR